MTTKRIFLNGFKQPTLGHAAVGLWRHPQSQAHRYKDLEYWLETAEIEGFNISDPIPLLSYLEFAKLVTLELQ